jgi:uncharacterized protein
LEPERRVEIQKVKEILSRHAALFRRAYIYGSVARGEADEYSDVDLILVRDTQRDFFDRVREVMPLLSDLVRVDALIYTEREIEALVGESGSPFLADAVGRGILVEGLQA